MEADKTQFFLLCLQDKHIIYRLILHTVVLTRSGDGQFIDQIKGLMLDNAICNVLLDAPFSLLIS